MAPGSKLLSYLTCLHTTTYMLLSIFSLVETITLEIWEQPGPGMQNVDFWFPSVAQKCHVLKLSSIWKA